MFESIVLLTLLNKNNVCISPDWAALQNYANIKFSLVNTGEFVLMGWRQQYVFPSQASVTRWPIWANPVVKIQRKLCFVLLFH